MSGTYPYRNPNQSSSPNEGQSEDDLNLDELDPLSNRESGTAREHRSDLQHADIRTYGLGIALRRLRPIRRGKGWAQGNHNYRVEDEDDLQELLDERGDRGIDGQNRMTEGMSGFAKHGRLRDHKSQAQTSRLASVGQISQLPEALRLDPNEPQGQLHVSNKESREILVGQMQAKKYPANIVSNAKYTAWSFLPRTLYNEFSFFLNIYFLLVALSQIIPYLRIGYMSTYIAPLAMVLTITIG